MSLFRQLMETTREATSPFLINDRSRRPKMIFASNSSELKLVERARMGVGPTSDTSTC